MDVVAPPAPGREIGMDSFADLTSTDVVEVGWETNGRLRVTFAGDLTSTEAAAVRRRIISATPAEEQLRTLIEAYLDNETTPTAEQMHQQLLRLTQLTTKVV